MKIKQLIFIITTCFLSVSCGSEKAPKESVSKEIKPVEIIPSGKEEIVQLLDYLNSSQLIINQTTSAELASLYEIAENDYYMTKKVELEDHTLYINFTISNGVLSKVSYATLSNSPKDFSYIGTLLGKQYGTNYLQTFNTNDSLAGNATKIWELDSLIVVYETFSDLNSGYEIIVK